MKKIFLALEAVSGLPRRVMFGGLVPALLLLLASAWVLFRGSGSYAALVLSEQMCRTGITLFSEGMVLGLFLDILLKRA